MLIQKSPGSSISFCDRSELSEIVDVVVWPPFLDVVHLSAGLSVCYIDCLSVCLESLS